MEYKTEYVLCGMKGVYWWCGYVLFPDVTVEDYPNETYREGNVVGVDTAHLCYIHLTLDEKKKAAEEQIAEIIEEHEKRTKTMTMDNEIEMSLALSLHKYKDANVFFLTDFEEKVFTHAFKMGYQEGRERGFKEGVKDAI